MTKPAIYTTLLPEILIFCTLLMLDIPAFTQNTGVFTDQRDGRTYKWIIEGKQTWMAENLKFKSAEGSWAYNSNDSTHVLKYGRLYDWKSATKACPSGWKLPAVKDWNKIIEFLGAEQAGLIMQALDTVRNDVQDGKTIQIQGSSSLLTGNRYPDGRFLNVGYWGGCWSATSVNDSTAVNFLFSRRTGPVGQSTNDKRSGYAVRCIKK